MSQGLPIQNSKILLSLKKVSGWTSVSRLFGLLRDIATTSLLGVSVFHDIFVVILRIPNLFRVFFAEGAFNQAFVPIYSDYQNKKNENITKDFINALAGNFLIVLFVFTLLVLLIAPIFIFIFAPGFYIDDFKRDIATDILRIMFPYLGLVSLVAFAGGIQNTHGKFSVPASTPIIFNSCLIIAAIYIAPNYELPIYVLSWGVVVAGLMQLLIQFFPLKQIDRLPVPKIDFQHPGVIKVFKLMIPAIIAGGIFQINLLVDTIFATLLTTGSPTWLYVSDRLLQFPLGIFAIAIGTILLPELSKLSSDQDKSQFIDRVKKGQRFVLFIGVPSFIGLAFCSVDLISTIFLRGQFVVDDVYQSSFSLVAFSFGLPFFMLMKVLTPTFFARKDTKTPMYIALISLIMNAFLNYILAFTFGFGHIGIAIGSSISAMISVLILEIILINQGIVVLHNPLNRFNISIIVPSLIMIIFLYFFSGYSFIDLNPFQRVSFLLFKVLVSISIYFSFARLIYGKPLKEIFA